jgi:2-polyprenyl-6-hydroxyphenyl methylase/3-demethylubiquinone-9 3-methyltransferase
MSSPSPPTPPDRGATFSFGRNWESYRRHLTAAKVALAEANIREWLSEEHTQAREVVDVGCGSGVHSLAFWRLGAARVVSFDVDPHSVAATLATAHSLGAPANWEVLLGSVLELSFLRSLGQFDVVYSWRVLHHTGALWDAMANVGQLVRPKGLLWLALYAKGPRYAEHLELKRAYNRASRAGKRLMEARHIMGLMLERLRAGRNPLSWNETRERGMDVYHDLVDWLGGLPYEVASPEEVLGFYSRMGFRAERVREGPEGGNSIYLFRNNQV